MDTLSSEYNINDNLFNCSSELKIFDEKLVYYNGFPLLKESINELTS